MVAKVNAGKNIRGMLNYNENKVREGLAICIHENMFGRDVARLSFNAKLQGLENFAERNKRASTKAVHISLNFHPDEKLNRETLCNIASSYMDKIGFGDQPYLVYQHFDAAHPHMHVVTTNITRDGKRILLYNIGKNQSEKARRQIEVEFNLVKASRRNRKEVDGLRPVNVQKVVYGKSATKRSISNVVRHVVQTYKYASLPELNAILSQFNVVADRGREGSVMYASNGLLYRIIDDKGKRVGVPVKASSIYGKPTLPYLEKQFKLNSVLKSPHKERLRKCIDKIVNTRRPLSQQDFIAALRKEGIHVLVRQNETGRVYGLTFVDNTARVVFNGSDLGKAYSAKALLQRLDLEQQSKEGSKRGGSFTTTSREEQEIPHNKAESDIGLDRILTQLVTAESLDFTSPDSATRKRRRKRKHKRRL